MKIKILLPIRLDITGCFERYEAGTVLEISKEDVDKNDYIKRFKRFPNHIEILEENTTDTNANDTNTDDTNTDEANTNKNAKNKKSNQK